MSRRGAEWLALLSGLLFVVVVGWASWERRARPLAVDQLGEDAASTSAPPRELPGPGATVPAGTAVAPSASFHPEGDRPTLLQGQRRRVDAARANEQDDAPVRVEVRDLGTGGLARGVKLRTSRSKGLGLLSAPTLETGSDGLLLLPNGLSLLEAEPPLHLEKSWDGDAAWGYRSWVVSGRVQASEEADAERDLSRVSVRPEIDGSSYGVPESSVEQKRRSVLAGVLHSTPQATPDDPGAFRIMLPYAPGIYLVARGRGWRPAAREIPARALEAPPNDLDIRVRPAVLLAGHVVRSDGLALDGYLVTCRMTLRGADLVETGLLGGVAWHVDASAGSAGLVCSLTKSSGPAGAFKFELPYDGDVTILVCPSDSRTPVATQEIGFSAA